MEEISREKEFEEKIARLRKDGFSQMHVVSDFDRTLTYAAYKGEKTPSLISELRNGKYLTKTYAAQAHALFDQYHPIEIDPDIPFEKKNQAMHEWWKRHYELLGASGLDERTIKKAVRDMVREGRLRLRGGVKEFLRTLHEKSVPMLIMSATGIGNMVFDFLKQNDSLYDNIYFVGNTLEFDERGKFRGIAGGTIIHSLNKREIEVKNLPFYEKVKSRKNVLLLGDSLADVQMAEGFDYNTIVRIGFFNPGEKGEAAYREQFDALVTGDGNFNFINGLLKKI